MLFWKRYSQKKKHSRCITIGMVLIISISLLFLCIPPGTAIVIAGIGSGVPESADYDPETDRLVVKTVRGIDLKALAEDDGGELLRTEPLDYGILQFKGLGTNLPEGEQIRQKVLNFPGVLSAEWGKKYKVSGSVSQTQTIIRRLNHDIATDTAGNITGLISDPEYSQQWALKKVRADQVWTEGATGEGIIVAVIDTGVDLDHPDLVDIDQNKNNLVQGYNAITRSALEGAAQDDNGHGTAVAGLIAALNNNKGIVGVAYNAKIMPIKAMDKTGEGEDSIIADGIIWAVDNGAKIINMSLASDKQNKMLDDAVQYAVDKGCLLVAASGNKQGFVMQSYSKDMKQRTSIVAYPGANPNVIAVSAVDMDDVIADFALTGPEVLLTAPGKKILTDRWSEKEDAGYTYSTGTSIAAPFVAGAAALIWSKYPHLKAGEIKQALVTSAYDLGEEGRDNNYGYGRVDIYRALKALEDQKDFPSMARLGWEGGRLYTGGTAEEPAAILTVPVGAFHMEVDHNGSEKEQSVSIHNATLPSEFPEGITPASDAFTVIWGEVPAEKALNLEIKLTKPQDQQGQGINPRPYQKGKKQIAYLYKWSGYRWVRVGGGVSDTARTMQVAFFEPGTYRAGWSDEPDIDRIAGNDRIQTSLEIARRAFPTGADTIIIARADDFPDALTGAPLAYKYHAPILLTNPEYLTAEAYRTVKDFNPTKIIILGGYEAVPSAIEAQLFEIAPVSRIAGENRYGTAAAIAELLGVKGQAILVNCSNFPDAVAAASHAAYRGKPILLTSTDMLSEETETALKKYSVTHTEVIGGQEAISDKVYSKLPAPRRLSGGDRFATSAEVIRAQKPEGRVFFIATGLNFPDALVGGVLASNNYSNIMLMPPDGPTSEQRILLKNLKGKKIVALGGTGVVSEEMIKKVKTLAN